VGSGITKRYTNGEVTVVWKPDVCIHSTICFRGLPGVFDPRKRPWVAIDGADTDAIIVQVKQCPSGALSYVMNRDAGRADAAGAPAVDVAEGTIVEAQPDGPLMVHGPLVVRDASGSVTKRERVTAFCRCGQSLNKPFCDGSHRKAGFKG
jgi:uncharacterized Fe-S cluster protein YjdI